MSHALIIEDNLIISQVIEKRLCDIGFDSFDHAWTEQQAIELASERFPDLIIVGDHLERGSGIAAARKINETRDVATLLVTAHGRHGDRKLPENGRLQGPHPINEIENAVRVARGDAVAVDGRGLSDSA